MFRTQMIGVERKHAYYMITTIAMAVSQVPELPM